MNAFLFPGQGSQDVGMGKDLYNSLPCAKEILDQANDILGYDLKKIMFEGPVDVLTDTRFAQPAVFTCSAMFLEKAKNDGIEYDYVAGHSLGEYSALYAAGVISFEDGLKLVSERGNAMAKMNGKGLMAAILGLAKDDLVDYLNDDVVIANYNTKTQLVISGSTDGINRVEESLSSLIESDEIRFRKLSVSGAFHSPQMNEVALVLKPIIDQLQMNNPKKTYVSNVSANPIYDIDLIKNNLIRQITCQVRWFESVLFIKNQGVDQFFEVGYGDVLKKINKGIFLRPKCSSIV